MTALLVADIVSYLEDAGWRRLAATARGAAIWGNTAQQRILVPPRDGMGDSDVRMRDVVEALSEAEERPAEDIVREIGSPLTDVQSYRIFPEGLPSGFVSLPAGAEAVHVISELFAASARAVLAGPSYAFSGDTAAEVDRLLRQIRLGLPSAGSYVLTVHLPADEPLGRQAGERLAEAVSAAGDAAAGEEESAFDATTAAGVSPEICGALSQLAGEARRQPFEIGFRWARARPTPVPARTTRFGEGAGERLRAAANRLRHLAALGDFVLTGVIESLHDDAARGDRWRIRVRGEQAGAKGGRRRKTVWVRFGDGASYDRAIAAHRAGSRVRVRGTLSGTGRAEVLSTGTEGFEVLE